MPRRIIINSTPQEARVALLDGPTLIEIFIERTRSRGVAGNIYKGTVTRVLPGMQAAFVDIGLEKAAFLHATDYFPDPSRLAVDEDVDPTPSTPANDNGDGPPGRAPIQDVLRKGHQLVVQVKKEPIGSKGARLTAHASLPGRFLVYTPTIAHLGVSRRIATEAERDRLRETLTALRPPDGGLIARTSCEGVTKKEITADLRFLSRLWARITKKAETSGAPVLLHYDMDLILRVIRDLFTADVDEVVVDNARDRQRITDFLDTVMPRLESRVTLYTRREPIFDRFGIEPQIARALERKVFLKSGASIVIDSTEALTAIDVNTGRYVGTTSLEETSLKANLEAVNVITHQLRLRNIGGLIVIDFIDMERAANRRQVFEALSDALKKDKTPSNVLRMSELGLVEMTRKRTRESLSQLLCAPCSRCDGSGRVQAPPTVAYALLRRIRHQGMSNPGLESITVRAHPDVAHFLTETEHRGIEELEREIGARIVIKASPDMAQTASVEIVCTERAPAPVESRAATEG